MSQSSYPLFFYLGKSIESKVHRIENLGAESDWLNLLINSTGEAIYGIDSSGDCTFVNSAFIKILRFASENDLLRKKMHNKSASVISFVSALSTDTFMIALGTGLSSSPTTSERVLSDLLETLDVACQNFLDSS
ncbi:PAS domain-containing protein [Candidatus Seongchinamella marina]|uniref:PAS domain-containing protein n=1 Tax=Candidatus Seongchinamella marina TaxID=2518990 RepID=UPI00243144EA|nr:PAS domain-containing protein [Candidatus Seongchinamella marina]